MTSSEYYERAAHDPEFRRAKLDDLRYLKFVGVGLIWFCGGLGAAVTLYTGFTEGRWDSGLGMFVITGMAVMAQANNVAQIAALEAIEAMAVQVSAKR